ncbi:MAG: ABC transporter permease [Pseudomonadota bacterium]|nr:ABC transporter permease [Pseudomonadota bacterium]
MILTIARRELQAGLLSPLGWVLLAANQLILAWMFLRVLERFSGLEAANRSAGLTMELSLNLFSFAAALALLSVPLLSMRMLSGEFREGTFSLLGAAPVSLGEILLGKFFGLAALVTLMGLLPLLMTLGLAVTADLDLGLLTAATLGLWLTGLMFAAVGLFASSLSAQPGLAAVVAYGVLVLLSVVSRTGVAGSEATTLFDWLSWNEHLFWFLLGVVRASDLLYFGLFTGFFLALAHRRLANRRLG